MESYSKTTKLPSSWHCIFIHLFIFKVPIYIWIFSEIFIYDYQTFILEIGLYLGEELSGIMLKGLSIIVGVLLIRFWLLVTECYGYHEEKQGTYSYDGTWIPPKKIISKR